MKPKFIYVLGGLYNGGQERQLLNLTIALRAANYPCEVIVWNKENYSAIVRKRFEDQGINCVFLEGGKRKRLLALRALTRDAAVVHSFTFYVNSFVWMATLGRKTMGIGGLRGDFRQYAGSMGWKKAWLNGLLPRLLIANSRIQGESLKKVFGWWAPKVEVVRNGYLNDSPAQPLEQLPEVAELISISRIVDYKRFDLVLEVLKQVNHPWHMTIIGTGDQEERIRNQAAELGIDKQITFAGEVTNVPDYLRASQIMLHMSDFEGTCNVIMESIALGRPVVATDVGDNSFLVQHGETGFLVPRGDVTAAAQHLNRLLLDPDLLKQFSVNAIEYAESAFSLTAYATNTLQAYANFGLSIKDRE